MLDLKLLDNVKHQGGRTITACPACRAAGNDKQGNHLVIYESGKFGCVANEGDSSHRSEIFNLVGIKDELSDTDKAEQATRARRMAKEARRRASDKLQAQAITQEVKRTLDAKLEPYLVENWRIDLLDKSPIRFDSPEHLRHDFIRSLYQPDDVLWLGDVLDSGSDKHKAYFKTCKQWLELGELPPRIASATFLPESFSRSSGSVKTSPFIVIESDDIIGRKPETLDDREANKHLSHALAGYAQAKLGLTLRAVIDTSNKSLHCWFDRPPPDELAAIKQLAAGLHIDSSALDQSHSPYRLPLCRHDKTQQQARVLFLNPIHKITP